MCGKVRRAYRYFKADYEAMCGYIELAAEGCGGANEFTRRAREALDAAEHALDECLERHGRKAGASVFQSVKRNSRFGRNVRYSMPESSCSETPDS
jgi:hypothetical protein